MTVADRERLGELIKAGQDDETIPVPADLAWRVHRTLAALRAVPPAGEGPTPEMIQAIANMLRYGAQSQSWEELAERVLRAALGAVPQQEQEG